MSSIKILMADDEPEILSIMAKRVTQEGYKVITAADGQEAWDKMIEEDPDVIISDVDMPRMDGRSFLRNLRQQPPGAKWQPVIFVSSLTDRDAEESCQAEHYIVKPCRIEDILKAIRLVLPMIPQQHNR